MTKARKVSYLLFGLMGLAVVALHLGPVVLAGLFSFMILDFAHKPLSKALPDLLSRWAALLVFTVMAVGLSYMFVFFIKMSLERTPVILGSLIPQIDSLAAGHGIELPFENLHEFRVVFLDTLKEHARSITQASGLLTKGFFQIVVGVFVAILVFFSYAFPAEKERADLYDELRAELNARSRSFVKSFELILGAQVVIAIINTILTAIFLLATDMPYLPLLVLATFIFGVIPVLGNVISNTIICSVALTVSPNLALTVLLFLVGIHKLEYFLNSRIVGSRINMPMWQILCGLLAGEVAMGVPGLILASCILHYAREELRSIPSSKARS